MRHGRVLLAHRRCDRRWYPNCWDLIGGHIEAGETPEVAVRRECAEEIGVEAQALHHVPMACSEPSIEMHAFLVVSRRGEPVNLSPEEHDALRWFRAGELSVLALADPASLPDIAGAAQVPSTLE